MPSSKHTHPHSRMGYTTEYQSQFPVWMEGQDCYKEGLRKQKLLAHASKSHTPIFGAVDSKPVATKEVVTDGKEVTVKMEPKKEKVVQEEPCQRSCQKKVTFAGRSSSAPPAVKTTQKVVGGGRTARRAAVRREEKPAPSILKTDGAIPTEMAEYLRRLCSVGNTRPIGMLI